MRVALIIPPVKDFYFTPQRASFLGVHTISGLLRDRKVEHRIFNGVRTRGRAVPLPSELSYLEEYLGSPHFFSGFRRFGITNEHLSEEVCRYAPDLALVSCFAFGYARETLEIIDALKEKSPGMIVVAGGAGVSAYPEYFLNHSRADAAVPGEAEACIDGLLRDHECVPGAWFRAADGGTRSNSRAANASPFKPVLVKIRESGDTVYYSAMISRGCPRRCSFCSVRITFPGHRWADASAIRSMIGDIPRTSRRVHVNFEDDNLLTGYDRFLEALEALASHAAGAFSFSMENGTEHALLDEGRIRMLKHFGITRLNLPLVSRDDRMLSATGRRGSADEFAAVAALCGGADIPVTAYIIAGLPGDDFDAVRDGIEFLHGLGVLVGVSPFYPVPGIAGYEHLGFFNTISPRLCTGAAFFPWHSLTAAELVELFRRARSASVSRKK